MAARYDIVFQNRTDIVTGGKLNITRSEVPLPADYAGEVIPPWACMRIAGPPTLYKRDLVWPVCLPDDKSDESQAPGLHLFNGPSPVPFMAYGNATQDTPCRALVDLTTFGNSYQPSNTAEELGGYALAIESGTWCLVSVGNEIGGDEILDTMWPYTIMGPDVYPDPDNLGELIYSEAIFWISKSIEQQPFQ